MGWMEGSKLLMAVQFTLAYSLITILIYFLSDYTIYQPKKPSYIDDEHVIKLVSKNGKKISAFYLENKKSKFTMLFSHGNAEDLGNVFPIIKALHEFGFSVLTYDYQGYGTSEGAPSEENTYMDIQAAYNYLLFNKKVVPQNIILFGRSLGTGPTLQLATHSQVGGVILEAPFLSAFRVISYIPLFPLDKYRNLDKIKALKVPLLVIHGTKDEVVPFWHGKRIFKAFTDQKLSLWITNGKHNDLMSIALPEYRLVVKNFAESL